MVTALLAFAAIAAACGIAVYLASDTRPLFRAVVVFGGLLATPYLAFYLTGMALLGGLPAPVAAVLVVLLGVGLYLVAGGSIPGHNTGAAA
ncbi:uncharacterized protein NP_0886A [Natronomonas pharaonis DSM 2160]|uniref:Uncharacterized protein n=1 Tax=Natronomonas pharaonis (strain ATCC 35678 / DSM 2160 / CIP 103997 / JCM 8858 / NBRC 14720 / NCIMB 2260 / Gabara) TaxID=348780 RepID=A0A1U7EU96_NATPD|nr:hypothetical protein [Natronomonas pharaonis]CAI48534.1 uncharacterized protein NP_0886A [Natronomonas pharaonis DSM 2160]